MKISYLTHPSNFNTKNGYGLAGYNMLKSLQALGHEVPYMDASAPVEIAFCQPDWADWSNPDAYHIMYTPWESTELPENWLECFNQADEVWTPSDLIAQWYRDAGVTVPVKVYLHGVDPIWSPGESTYDFDRYTFLSHGSPATRKNTQAVVDAFLELYGNSTEHQLIIKSAGETEARIKDQMGNIIADIYDWPNIKVVSRMMNEEELVDLYRGCDSLVYPSWGEGFGLIPLQALAVGLPTICTEAWAPYRNFFHPFLSIGSTLVDSPWPSIHPGKMFEPHFEEIVANMNIAANNAEKIRDFHVAQAPRVSETYDWMRLTEEAFAPVVEKFTSKS